MNKSFEKILELIEQNTLKNRDSISFFNECGINFISASKAKEIVQKVEREYNGGWIPCSESLPNDCDNRFYMCLEMLIFGLTELVHIADIQCKECGLNFHSEMKNHCI